METTPRTPQTHSTLSWWGLLGFTGGVSLLFNIWHAVAPPNADQSLAMVAGRVFLGIIVGVVPVGIAAWLSHGLTSPLFGWQGRVVIVGVFVAAMAMSIYAQSALLAPILGTVLNWVLPIMIDTAALLSLRAITKAHALNKMITRQVDIEADMARLRVELRPAVEADIRAEYEARLPDIRQDMAEDIRKDMAAEFEVQRVDIAAEIEADMREEMSTRWAAAEEDMRREVEFKVRRELAVATKTGERRAINPGKSTAPKMTSEKRLEIVRQAILDGDTLTLPELADLIEATTRTAGRLRTKVRKDMGLEPNVEDGADDGRDDTDTDDDVDPMSTPMSRLRIV